MTTTRLRFGRCEVRPAERLLLIDGRAAALGARAFDLLLVLIEQRDRVVLKPQLLELAWPGLVVEENNLSVQISVLRKWLGPAAIATVPGRGYRFVAALDEADPMPLRASEPRPSIAVLPFTNLSGDPQQEYFADGVAEDIIGSLAHSPWLFVIARSSSFAWRSAQPELRTICSELGVRYVVSGSVRRLGPLLRVTAELADGLAGETLWAERYDRPVESLFDLQDQISATIVGTIEPLYLRREEQRAAQRGPRDLQHWDLVMRARWHYWRSTRWHSLEAKRLLEQALQLQPNDVASNALLAFSLFTDVWSGWCDDTKAVIERGHHLARRAVTLDDRDAFAHFTMGVAMACMGQMDRAIAEQRRALALYPHFAAAAAELGRLLAFSGQTQEARQQVLRAMAASPSDPRLSLWLFTLAIISFVDGDYRRAAQHASDAVVQRPDWFFNHYLQAACLAAAGEGPRAREALAEAQRMMPRFTAATLTVGHPFTRAEHRERYIAALRSAGWAG